MAQFYVKLVQKQKLLSQAWRDQQHLLITSIILGKTGEKVTF